MNSIQLFQHAFEQWQSRKPAGREQVYAFCRELEADCIAGTNLYVVDMRPDDPFAFGPDVLVQNVDMQASPGTFRQYPDQEFIGKDVVPFYQEIKQTGRESMLRMKSRIQGHFVVYDRIMLPMKDDGSNRWALSMTKTRVLVPPLVNLRSLTDRQQDILTLAAEGHSSKTTAQRLGVSHRTVEHQIAAIKKKLDAKNITEAVAKFVGNTLSL